MVVENLSSHGYPHFISGPRLLYVLGILELMAFPLLGAGTFSMAPDEKMLADICWWNVNGRMMHHTHIYIYIYNTHRYVYIYANIFYVDTYIL